MSRTPTPAERDAAESRERLEADLWRIFASRGITRYLGVGAAAHQRVMDEILSAIDQHAGRLGDIWTEQSAAEARLSAARAEHSPATMPGMPGGGGDTSKRTGRPS